MRVVGGGGALCSLFPCASFVLRDLDPSQTSFCFFAWPKTSYRRGGQTGKATRESHGIERGKHGYLSVPARPAGRKKGRERVTGTGDEGRGTLPCAITLGSFLRPSPILPLMWLAADLAIARDLELRGYVRIPDTGIGGNLGRCDAGDMRAGARGLSRRRCQCASLRLASSDPARTQRRGLAMAQPQTCTNKGGRDACGRCGDVTPPMGQSRGRQKRRYDPQGRAHPGHPGMRDDCQVPGGKPQGCAPQDGG